MYEPLKKRNEAMAAKINSIEKEVELIRIDTSNISRIADYNEKNFINLMKLEEDVSDLKELLVSIYNSAIEKMQILQDEMESFREMIKED